MLSQFKMNPDPAYQNRIIPEREDASFFDGYSVWFYKEQGELQQAEAFSLEFEIAPFGISSEGVMLYFPVWIEKTSEGMAKTGHQIERLKWFLVLVDDSLYFIPFVRMLIWENGII